MGENSGVIVIGAGPAGLALACALADNGRQVTVIERAPRATLRDPAPDGRDIALTHRGRALLQAYGIWQHLPAGQVAPIRQARVVDGGSPFFLGFDTRDSGKDELGYLVGNDEIRRACFAAALERPGVQVIDSVAVTQVAATAERASVSLADGRELQAPLVVAADSRFSENRRRMGIGADLTDFGRTVIVVRLAHDLDHQAVAHECFHYGRTLALLPLNGRMVSAVITIASDQVPALMAMPDQTYADMVRDLFGARLGAMSMIGQRHAYPLVAVYARRFVAQRFALAGDAAVGMHPVTAHGYNFGLYGVDSLTRALATAADPGDAVALARYDEQHRRATLPIYLGTNAMVRLFTDDRLPARVLRSTVLRLADRLPPLKAGITRQLTGARRRMPGLPDQRPVA